MSELKSNSKQNPDTESIISRCGSISGETFVSLRSRRSCAPGRTPHKIDRLAQNLKDYHSQTATATTPNAPSANSSGNSGCRLALGGHDDGRARINTCFHHYRFIVAMLGGISVGIMLFHRYSMSISILRMVNQTHLYLEEHPNKTMQDFIDEGYTAGGEFLWNNEIVAIILGWYMFSYTLPQTLAAKCTMAIGCRYAMPISLIVCAIANMLTPAAAYMGWEWVVACRLLNGLGGAGLLPGMLHLLEDWMRYDELSSGLSTAQILIACCTAICPLISGYLTAIHWSRAFFVPGYVTIGFCVIWMVLITDKPQTNWLVSMDEMRHLCECSMATGGSMPNSVTNSNDTNGKDAGKIVELGSVDDDLAGTEYSYKPDSWLQILGLKQFYAYLLIWILNCSSYTGFTFVLPAYMRQFLKIPISENGFYCFIIQLGVIIAVSWPHQALVMFQRAGFSITRARKISQGVSSFMMIITWLYVGTFHQYQLPLLFLNRCFVASDVIVTASVMSNFAKAGMTSLAFAMINTIGNLSITGTTTIIGWVLDYTGSSPFGWQMVFYGLALSQVIMFLTFALFIDSEPIKFKSKSKKQQLQQQQQLQQKKPQQDSASLFTVDDFRRDSMASAKVQEAIKQQPLRQPSLVSDQLEKTPQNLVEVKASGG